MARQDGRLEPGQKLDGAISARAWNRMMDAADFAMVDRLGMMAESSTAVVRPYTWTWCRPNINVTRWGIVAITDIAIAAEGTDSDTPLLTGEMPTEETFSWAVAVEPIESGKIGKVAVSGVVPCRIEVVQSTDRFVRCKNASGELRTSQEGQGLILFKNSASALIRLGIGSMGIRRGTFTAPWDKSSLATVTGTSFTGTVVAKNYFANITGAGTKNCAVAYVGSEWILIAAEC